MPIDTAAVSKEVSAYSPAEGFRRFQTIEVPLPSLAESLKSGEVPVHLLPSAGLLIAFEGKGTEALAPVEAKKVMDELTKVGNKAYERQTTREATVDWLWRWRRPGTFGLGLAGSDAADAAESKTATGGSGWHAALENSELAAGQFPLTADADPQIQPRTQA